MCENELGDYIKMLELRVKQVEEQIREIGRQKLGKEEVAQHPDIVYLVYLIYLVRSGPSVHSGATQRGNTAGQLLRRNKSLGAQRPVV